MESKKKCVFGCDSLGAYMHRFPHPQKYSEMFILWLSSVGDNMQEKDHMKIYNTKRVCDYHFEFEVKVSGHRLLKSAVPTMYLQGVKKSNTIKVQLEHNYCLPRMLNTNTVSVPSTSQLLHESVAVNPVRMKSAVSKSDAQRIVWVDLEMTGLDVHKDHILEIACLITDADLNVVTTGPNIIIHQPDHILNKMDEWCIATHGESGLTEASRKSKTSLLDAEQEVLKFVQAHVPEKRCPLGGNSVYMDRLFLREYMPHLNDYLHYRIIDVSSIKELAKRWYSKEFSKIPAKKFQHRAMSDIMDTLEELKYYREHIFKQ